MHAPRQGDRRRSISLGLFLAAPWIGAASAVAELHAGASVVDVTPQQFPVFINGSMTARRGEPRDIKARALVLADGDTTVAIVVADSCMLPKDLVDDAKALTAKRTGIPADHMTISATHTHTAPSAMGALGTPADETYVPYLRLRLADAIAEAHGRLEPARVGYASTSAAEFTALRRWIVRLDRVGTDPFGSHCDTIEKHFASPDRIPVAIMSHGCSGDIWRVDYRTGERQEPFEGFVAGMVDRTTTAVAAIDEHRDADIAMAQRRPRPPLEPPDSPLARRVRALDPVCYYPLDEMSGPVARDAGARHRDAVFEDGVVFWLDGPDGPKLTAGPTVNRAAHFAGGRMRSRLPGDGRRVPRVQSHHQRPAGRLSAPPRSSTSTPSSSMIRFGASRAMRGWTVTPPPIGVRSLLPRHTAFTAGCTSVGIASVSIDTTPSSRSASAPQPVRPYASCSCRYAAATARSITLRSWA
jgi:hypothetical protein